MTPALVRFVEALRAGGIRVSPAELLDAARALDVVGLSDRARVRAALRATLAKDRRCAAPFDRVFDAFFATPRSDGSGRVAGKISRMPPRTANCPGASTRETRS